MSVIHGGLRGHLMVSRESALRECGGAGLEPAALTGVPGRRAVATIQSIVVIVLAGLVGVLTR